MKVELTNINRKTVLFRHLRIGDCYRDVEGEEICIKTGIDRCIFLHKGNWISMAENKDEPKYPLQATLTVEE